MSVKYLKRYEAVFLVYHSKGPKLTYKSAAKHIKKSESFVKKWVKRFSEVGNVDDLPERGSSRVTTEQEDRAIIRLFQNTPGLSLRTAQLKLRKKGIDISLNTIRSRMSENDISFRSTLKKPLLSEKHVEKRLNWAKENLDRDWSNVIFTDESSFWAWSSLSKAWTSKHNRLLQRTVKHPVKVNVWGCFCQSGFGCLFVFTGILNAERMCKIYQKCLMRSAKKFFGSDTTTWVLQEDNDPKHRSKLCSEWKRQNNIITMAWPAMSPDANPIENVWSYIKMQLRGRPVFTEKQLRYQIRKIWRSLPSEYAENLVKSMNKRCEAIINNNGDWTNY
ncbi:hypothetical protein O3G_MSEX007545 [Manduca sexta]|uniref:Transposase n=1 Tax=Manduca sexta TaxID=7130 RepID=A0A922CNB9_MANSE|nr:hypothetical protein O3G_MSEX007545 [Manduca sexta]